MLEGNKNGRRESINTEGKNEMNKQTLQKSLRCPFTFKLGTRDIKHAKRESDQQIKGLKSGLKK